MRYIEGVFAGLADRPPTARFTGNRPHKLRMTIPAAFPDIYLAAERLLLGVVGRHRLHPFQLAKIGAHHLGNLRGARLGFQHGQYALSESSEAYHQETGAEGDCAHVHSAAPPAANAPSGTGSGLTITVIIRLKTNSDIPTSIDIPATVRTSQ